MTRNKVKLEDFTKKRINKLEEQLHKVRKENRVKKFTNNMHEVLNEKNIPADMHPYNLNDLSYVINQNLKRVREGMKAKVDGEASTLNVPQPIVGEIISGGTSFEGPTFPLLAPLVVPGRTNFEGPRSLLLTRAVDPISVIPSGAPLMDPPQTVPLVGRTTVPYPPLSPSFISEMFPPVFLQLYPPIPQQMTLKRAPRMIPPTIMVSPRPS
ncbi:hypothetical protein RND71_001415 [Anisodus tanguticus]|uniref:Uncharacterized protein n=1 Tax=Anisodus tanguticus TaxID=243964 RepID=A0AAE1VQW4_9SOLA|nr:hypothetical protein RND71_001415 [Anisodus tanguticus]